MKGNFLLVFSQHSQADKTSMSPGESVPERDELIGNQADHSQLLQTDFPHSSPHSPAEKPDSLTSHSPGDDTHLVVKWSCSVSINLENIG